MIRMIFIDNEKCELIIFIILIKIIKKKLKAYCNIILNDNIFDDIF